MGKKTHRILGLSPPDIDAQLLYICQDDSAPGELGRLVDTANCVESLFSAQKSD